MPNLLWVREPEGQVKYHFSVSPLNSKAKQYLRASSKKARHQVHLRTNHHPCRAALPHGLSPGPTP